MYQFVADHDTRPVAAMSKTVGSVKYNLILELVLIQKLHDHLNHFLVSPCKTRASQAYSDLSFKVFHE